MVDLVSSPFFRAFEDFIRTVETSCTICSPYITRGPVERLLESIQSRNLSKSLEIKVITDISADNLLSGSTDISALRTLAENVSNSTLVYLPRIHAKVFISESRHALIGSANFTDGASFSNLEYGVQLTDARLVRQVVQDLDNYAALGGNLTLERLGTLDQRVQELRSKLQEERNAIKQAVSTLSEEIRRKTEDELIRVRVEGQSIASVFTKSILYLLAKGPMSTDELNGHIKALHPDLCDDIDRVIDGQHFGKLWKHQVRTAQQHLKRKKQISYSEHERIWYRTPMQPASNLTDIIE